MILPGSYVLTVALLVLSLLCWGSWANSLKGTGKWRYELFCFDFAIGMVVAALVVALTFGNLGWDGFSFLDDVRNAGKRQELFAFLAGGVFNLGNILMLGAASLAGISVAFPVALGVAIIVGVVWAYFTNPGGNLLFLGLGCAAVAVAVVLASLAYRALVEITRKQAPVSPIKGKTKVRVSSGKALVIALAAGLLLGTFPQLVNLSRETDNGLGPYGIAFIFAAGVLATTFVYGLFFMNLPVQGQPVDFGEYFKGSAKQHVLGMVGGMLWSVGLVASLVTVRAEGPAHPGPALAYAMAQGGTVLTALWGLIYWKEFSNADAKDKTYMFIMLVLLGAGIAAISVSSLFSTAS